MARFMGAPYPIVRHPNGLLHTQNGIDQIKSDLLILFLTNLNERVMMPEYGTPLRELFFNPNDPVLKERARAMIANSIEAWEPRVSIEQIEITNGLSDSDLNPLDTRQNTEHILGIKVRFVDYENLQEIQELKLDIPLGGS